MDDAANITLAYYDAHARAFADATVNVEFTAMQRRFMDLLAPGSRILDLGCGSGRDARAFVQAGFKVTATDGSAELCKIAEKTASIPVRHERFGELADTCAYEGVWACSSILHLPRAELADVMRRIARALVPQGVAYVSFKYGAFEGLRGGRHFTDFTEKTFRAFVDALGEPAPSPFSIEQLWVSADVRPERANERWLNALLCV